MPHCPGTGTAMKLECCHDVCYVSENVCSAHRLPLGKGLMARARAVLRKQRCSLPERLQVSPANLPQIGL